MYLRCGRSFGHGVEEGRAKACGVVLSERAGTDLTLMKNLDVSRGE